MSTVVATSSRRRWGVLAAGVAAQASTSVFQFGMPYLVPQLRQLTGGDLVSAGLLVACPNLGLMLTLIVWGWVADAIGERVAMTVGLAVTAVLLAAAAASRQPVALGVLLIAAGAAGASVNAASGRVVMAWFGPHERGLAMGVRQTAQPLGVAIAALTLPVIAAAAAFQVALLLPAVLCLLAAAAVLLIVRDPQRAARDFEATPVSPYRHAQIWRVHAASALLIVPQFTISSYGYLYLVEGMHLPTAVAGLTLGVTQLVGAGGRLAAGRWSDMAGDRFGPMRILAVGNAAILALFTVAVLVQSWLSVPLLLISAVVTVSGNGLAFTAVAEIGGRAWSGRALGVQNTVQNAVAFATPGAVGGIITATGFAAGFGAAVCFPALAAAAVPRSRRRRGAAEVS